MKGFLALMFAAGAGLVAYLASKTSRAAPAGAGAVAGTVPGVSGGGIGTTSAGQPVPLTSDNMAQPAGGDSVAEQMANAISRGPDAMRATAAELRRQGHTQAADALLAAIEVATVGLPSVVQTPEGPKQAPAPVSVEDAPAKIRAQALTVALRAFPPQRDDARVRAYQQQEGLEPDGLYGPDTASAVARAGVIPVPPAFFARDPTRRRLSIDSYRALIAEQQRKLGGDWSSALRGLPS